MQLVLDQTRALIANLAPLLRFETDTHPAFTTIRLAPAPGADYLFQLYVYEDGEPQIGAELLEPGDANAFWSWSFEIQDFDSEAAQRQAFLEGLQAVLSRRTRISRRSGLLFHAFRCEVLESASWIPLGPGVAFLRWGHRPPMGTRWESPPVSSGTSPD